jgi:hypothetical protein
MRERSNLRPTIRTEVVRIMTHFHAKGQESTDNAAEETAADSGHAM